MRRCPMLELFAMLVAILFGYAVGRQHANRELRKRWAQVALERNMALAEAERWFCAWLDSPAACSPSADPHRGFGAMANRG